MKTWHLNGFRARQEGCTKIEDINANGLNGPTTNCQENHTSVQNGLYKVSRMYHPTLLVPDLDASEKFFSKVFGRESIPMAKLRDYPPGYVCDYSIFTPIADLFFDSIDPVRYVIDGFHPYVSSPEPHLAGFGWGVDANVDELYHTLIANGIRSTDQACRPADPKIVPQGSMAPVPVFKTLPEDTGLRYTFSPTDSIPPADPRSDPSWTLPPVSENDPLGIQFCSHHTVLTSNLERATKILVQILGGTIISKGYNELRGTDSTYVALADGVFELAIPTREGSIAMEDWKRNAPFDTYHALTFKVKDLDKSAKQLSAKGVRLLARDDSTLITDPRDTMGTPWGFTTDVVPNDPRI